MTKNPYDLFCLMGSKDYIYILSEAMSLVCVKIQTVATSDISISARDFGLFMVLNDNLAAENITKPSYFYIFSLLFKVFVQLN